VNARRVLSLIVAGWVVLLAWPSSTAACSAPFEQPTIRALGPAQLVVVGTVGERVPGGRLFHVERWFNGGEPGTPIVIAFKEGEPIGDCSYPVATGEQKIIAPWRETDGRLSADLGTLQADPHTEDGRRYLAEAVALFGPGVVPEPVDAAVDPMPATEGLSPLLIVVVGVVLGGVVIGLVLRARAFRGRSD
jgi:hypothetical protein